MAGVDFVLLTNEEYLTQESHLVPRMGIYGSSEAEVKFRALGGNRFRSLKNLQNLFG